MFQEDADCFLSDSETDDFHPHKLPKIENNSDLYSMEKIHNVSLNLVKRCDDATRRKIAVSIGEFNPEDINCVLNLQEKINECEYPIAFFVLINVPYESINGHCFLLEINVEEKHATYYDCEHDKIWAEIIEEALEHKKKYEGVSYIHRECHQQTENGKDCGVIVLMYLEDILSGSKPSKHYPQSQIDSKRKKYDKMYLEDIFSGSKQSKRYPQFQFDSKEKKCDAVIGKMYGLLENEETFEVNPMVTREEYDYAIIGEEYGFLENEETFEVFC